jgi:hypothetical protein
VGIIAFLVCVNQIPGKQYEEGQCPVVYLCDWNHFNSELRLQLPAVETAAVGCGWPLLREGSMRQVAADDSGLVL